MERKIHSTVTKAVDTELAKLPAEIQAIYLPEGNEARLKQHMPIVTRAWLTML